MEKLKPVRPCEKTRRIRVGNVEMGAGAPCVVQSMLSVPADDIEGNMNQLYALAGAGCEVVRMAIPNKKALESFEYVCKHSPVPIIADIHFSADLAIQAAKRGASKLRINPGNIGGLEKTKSVLQVAKECNIPIRIGVNAGSLDRTLKARNDLSLPEKLALSAKEYVEFCEQEGFYDLVVSAKAHDVPTTIEAYRILAQTIPDIPLHIGVTEAGTLFQGLIKSSAGLGVLLEQGIGDTMRISLTDDPVEEVRACWSLLSALGLRRRGVEIVSCPTCGRCQVDMIKMAKQVEQALRTIDKPITVAVMGCVVNGPGEAEGADIGVACGRGSGIIFHKGKTLRKVPEEGIVNALLEEIKKL